MQQTVMSPTLWFLLGSSPRLMPAADLEAFGDPSTSTMSYDLFLWREQRGTTLDADIVCGLQDTEELPGRVRGVSDIRAGQSYHGWSRRTHGALRTKRFSGLSGAEEVSLK